MLVQLVHLHIKHCQSRIGAADIARKNHVCLACMCPLTSSTQQQFYTADGLFSNHSRAGRHPATPYPPSPADSLKPGVLQNERLSAHLIKLHDRARLRTHIGKLGDATHAKLRVADELPPLELRQ